MKIMGSPGLPSSTNSSPTTTAAHRETIALMLAGGITHTEIARRLAPKDLKRQKIIRNYIRRTAFTDKEFREQVAQKIKAVALLDMGAAVQSLIQRAIDTGRPDAVKLALELTGVHAPRVEHEHSGEVAISFNLPRPAPVDTEPTAIEGKAEEID